MIDLRTDDGSGDQSAILAVGLAWSWHLEVVGSLGEPDWHESVEVSQSLASLLRQAPLAIADLLPVSDQLSLSEGIAGTEEVVEQALLTDGEPAEQWVGVKPEEVQFFMKLEVFATGKTGHSLKCYPPPEISRGVAGARVFVAFVRDNKVVPYHLSVQSCCVPSTQDLVVRSSR